MEKRISFYVKYSEGFTEDIYKKLWNWSVKNSLGLPRGWCDTYERLKQGHYFLFDNWGLNSVKFDKNKIEEQLSYGVDNNSQCIEKELSIKEVMELIDTPSQLLGETECHKFKIGDIVRRKKGSGPNNMIGELTPFTVEGFRSDGWILHDRGYHRPDYLEIVPQEEVEYVECIETTLVNCGAEKGVIYQVIKGGYGVNGKEIIAKGGGRICDLKSPIANINFKPSTREAYEAQQRKQECDCFDGCIKCKNVNKCSTINTNQNGTTKSKSSEVLPRKSYDFPRGEGETTTNLPIKRYNFPR